MLVVKVEEVVEAENNAAVKIAAETVDTVDLTCISRTTPGLILRGIDGQERITHDILSIKGASNLHRECFCFDWSVFFFNCFVMKLCDIKLV